MLIKSEAKRNQEQTKNKSRNSAHKELSIQFFDARIESIKQKNLQTIANNSLHTQRLNNFKEKSNTKEKTIQGMFTQSGASITDLAALNTEITSPAYSNQTNTRPIALPILATHFNRGQTAAEVDTAVRNSVHSLHDYIEISDIWDAIDAELITITSPPPGHSHIANGPFSAYVDSQILLTHQQQNLLINAVNGLGDAVHQSKKTHGISKDADAYIHDYGANAIFSYQLTGNHRGTPKVKILQQGKVNDGQHNF
ncbi:hypothetical protein [Oryzomicrobium sp.]|uniref:hypothetical protein n=1 Tax=Oryzomicrobium sp. TaxID=1911578 RepID=UPI0025F270E6|nr:hypothetical protein [Oryzomicrobium sp.]MCE1243510.1 hypothetical protein [Oryzomicrobium sp.]